MELKRLIISENLNIFDRILQTIIVIMNNRQEVNDMAKKHQANHRKCTSKVKHAHAVETKMDTEFGADFIGDAKRAAHAVETRAKTNAQRYGFCQED